MRNLISTQWHALLDYLLAIMLLIGPWFFNFPDDQTGKTLCLASGGMIVLFNLFTKHELGIIRVIPMSLHLNLDLVMGIFLILSVFLFDMQYGAYMLLVLSGAIILGSSLYTKPYMKKHTPPVKIKYDTERD